MLFIKIKKLYKIFSQNKRGNILLFALVFGTITMTVIIVGVAGYTLSENRASIKKHNRELAFQVADAGINYYSWHLAHDKTDYYDGNGTSTPGPYVHDYLDKDGNVVGQFSLDIATPTLGSTIVTIESTGWTTIQPESTRIIKARIGFPSMTDYAFLTNGNAWIGDNEEIHGKYHANGGIRFDGVADAAITSAVATYYCQPLHGNGCNNSLKDGIWGDGGPTGYWAFPVPARDFSAITDNLADIRTASQAGGIYLSSSGEQGWALTFVSDGTISIKKVLTTDCYNSKDVGDSNWVVRCIDAATYDSATTSTMPSNGYIFVDDMVWVSGTVNGRAAVGTSAGKSIIINGNINYLARDGNHTLGLIGEQNVLIPRGSPDDLTIDAAMIAQNGATKRYDFSGEGGDDRKDSLNVYGSVVSNGIWTWSWINSGGQLVSGYNNTVSTYDANLTYSPPPGFPVGSEYNLISWEVVK